MTNTTHTPVDTRAVLNPIAASVEARGRREGDNTRVTWTNPDGRRLMSSRHCDHDAHTLALDLKLNGATDVQVTRGES